MDAFRRRSNALTVSTLDILYFLEIKVEWWLMRKAACYGAKGLVRKERLELSRLAALEPKSSASTNSATFALFLFQLWADYITKLLFH